jgi:putative drug exporter of the RND superfamily
LIGIVAAAVVLLTVFGSPLATALPILTAIAGLGTAIMSLGLLTNGFVIDQLAPTLAAVIGLGVGIDYALFIVTRCRAGLTAGLGVEESVVKAVDTAGRAVLLAGGAVIIALLGMLVLGVRPLCGMAVGAALAVLFTVVSSITLLPALLGCLGTRTLSRRERRALAAGGPVRRGATGGIWDRWAGLVRRRPGLLSLVAAAVMAVLTIPVFSLRLGSSDAGNNPTSMTSRQAYDLLARGFGPGFNGPLLLVAQVPTPGHLAPALAARARELDGVANVIVFPMRGDATVGVLQVVPTTAPQSERTSALIRRLRRDVIPAVERDTGMRVYVGGQTAVFDDYAVVLSAKMARFIAVIVGLSFLLLLVAFRSLLAPATAAVMNLFAAGASFGVIVAFFQWGWGSNPLGMGASGPVEPFLPVMMLPVLFGLSMDYQVFLVSRMREEWLQTRDNGRAVTVGQAQTGRVITAAAVIMVAVFLSFVVGGERVIGEFGIGLAAAVALDAFILRTVLVPAAMHLFGRANWWFPRWLDRRVPRLSIDPIDVPAVPAPPAQPQPDSAARLQPDAELSGVP